jgi:hypothetical protein
MTEIERRKNKCADHPIAWTHVPANSGRFFYIKFGHDLRPLSTLFVRQHTLEAIKWAGKKQWLSQCRESVTLVVISATTLFLSRCLDF